MIHTERYQATLAGKLHLRGTPDAPEVTGRIEVLNATIHPDLAFLTATKYTRDDTIVVIRPGKAGPPVIPAAITEQARGDDLGGLL